MASKLKELSLHKDYAHLEKLYENFFLDKLSLNEEELTKFYKSNPDAADGHAKFFQTFNKFTNEYEVDIAGKDSYTIINALEDTLQNRCDLVKNYEYMRASGL